MAILMICAGSAGGVIGDDGEDVGKYLAAFDLDAHDGYGEASWTSDESAAIRFDDLGHAFATWTRQSTVRPTRPWDGKANRPLTAYTVTFKEID